MNHDVPSGISEEAGVGLYNLSGLPDSTVQEDGGFQKLVREISRWSETVRSGAERATLFDRYVYTPPANVYDEIRSARIAVEHDDVVSGVADITEAFAFQGAKLESTDADATDVFNQWAAEVNLDALLRKMWREEYAASQSVMAMVWDWREYTVRGKGTDVVDDSGVTKKRGRKRRKTYRLWVPVEIRLLDTTKVVPVNFSPVGDDELAWFATESDLRHFDAVQSGIVADAGVDVFFTRRYKAGADEERSLRRLGIDPDRLLVMNPEVVWRHTLTRADYQMFPEVRLKSVFGLLDMKRQLMNADRASLVGAANYILLIRKGTDDRPAAQAEIDHLKESYKFISKLPAIIADHRLTIDIIAPKQDFTLQSDKYDLIDTRILMRLLGTLSLGARGQRNETNITLSHAVARMMENRRHMIRRSLEKKVVKAIVNHPRNTDSGIVEAPSVVFLPRNVTLGFDAALLQAMLNLRTQREISRETVLENFGLDQATEALRMEVEQESFDDIFQTHIPFDGTTPPNDPAANGRLGGRPQGGGEPSQDATQVIPKTPSGNSKKGS